MMKQDTEAEILAIRHAIDNIDSTILSLLQRRLNCAKEIGKLKETENRDKWDPLREQEILQRLLAENNDIFPEETLTSIFNQIITTCRLLQ